MTEKKTAALGQHGAEAEPGPPIFDERQQQLLERAYKSEDRTAMRMEILRSLEIREGESVLEIGSGPGMLAREIALAVGPAGRVVGVDVNPGFVEMAARRCADLPWVEFRQGRIEEGLPVADGEFDAVTAAAVLQYVAEADLVGVLAEFHRALRQRGRALIHDTEWDSVVRYSRNRERMKRVQAAWRSMFANPHLFQNLAPKLRAAGFAVHRREVFPTFHPELHLNTLGYEGMEFFAESVTGRLGVTREEAEAWRQEQIELGREGSYFYCVLRFLFVALRMDGPG